MAGLPIGSHVWWQSELAQQRSDVDNAEAKRVRDLFRLEQELADDQLDLGGQLKRGECPPREILPRFISKAARSLRGPRTVQRA